VFKTKQIHIKEPPTRQLRMTFGFFLRNWHIFLSEDGTFVPKYVGEPYLIYVIFTYCAFGWYSLKVYADIKNARNDKL